MRYIANILWLLLIALAITGNAETNSTTKLIYVIPIKGPIDKAALYLVRRGVKDAETHKYDGIIFTMNTPGGGVKTADEIVKNILNVSVPTYTFVEEEAISAGAIIAAATRKIYMAPGSRIGDAIPIIISSGGIATLEGAEREKMEAYTDVIVRGIAEQTGRDPDLLTCMVRKDAEYKIGNDIISPKGKILVLTNNEASRKYGKKKKPLLSEGTVETLEDLLEKENLINAKIKKMEITWAEKLFQQITLISPILIGLGILSLWISFQNPTFAPIGLTVSIICFTIFFFGHHVAGLAGHEEMIVFVIGIILVLVEIVFIPGFGLIGILGMMMMGGALLAAMIQIYPGSPPGIPGKPWMPGIPVMSDFSKPSALLSLSIIGSGLGIYLLSRFVPRSRVFRSTLVLEKEMTRHEGFDSAYDHTDMEGKTGKALTDLHPAGKALIEDRPVDVFTQGDFIDEGTLIRIMEVHGNRIIVTKQEN